MALTVGNLTIHECEITQELYAIWPKIREGINSIEKRCKGIFYRPEDVYFEIKSGKVKLLLAEIDGVYEGFAVVRVDHHADGPCLHIWTMTHAGEDPDFVANMFSSFDQIAKLVGAVRVSYSSSRAGWLKACKQLGYKPVATIVYFERSL